MKIVIVEDEAPIRNGLGKMLPKLGTDYEVAGIARDGEEGLKVIARTMPDLVIMDIQMPRMDGLTMLSELRAQGVRCKVVVLTAYSDFTYAKKAIELGIENYLLKPIKLPELKKTLEIIQEELAGEQGQETLLTLDKIFRGSLLAELPIDEKLNQLIKGKYDLDVGEHLAIFSVWLGEHYSSCASDGVRVLEECVARASDYRGCVIVSERYSLILAVLYRIADAEKLRKTYGDSVVPMLSGALACRPVYTWGECEGLAQAAECYTQVLAEREWGLNYPDGTLISPQKIEETVLSPLKYPIGLEDQIRQAIAGKDQKGFGGTFRQLLAACMDQPHHPDDIREACMRYCISLISVAKNTGNMKSTMQTQTIFQQIGQAFNWEQIGKLMEDLYQSVSLEKKEDDDVSLMVKRAKQLMEEYYNQGITLDEIAQRLCVSEEYLSTQFKKETGTAFSETMRKYKIDKVKELLLHSSLKLNQIADMAGYSDPKYMSKVFKDETGMLPAEFRKGHI